MSAQLKESRSAHTCQNHTLYQAISNERFNISITMIIMMMMMMVVRIIVVQYAAISFGGFHFGVI